MSQPSTTEGGGRVAAIAARCVMCGLCLPHCPSYRVRRDETDSPRGRLALMATLASGQLEPLSGQPSLDRCLACGACERACPAGVSFIEGLTLTRSQLAPARESAAGRIARLLSRRPALLAALARLATSGRRLLPRKLRRRMNLDGLASLRVNLPAASKAHAHPSVDAREQLLLTGCAGKLLEANATRAIQAIAHRLQIPLRVDDSRCCGALDAHLGKSGAAGGRETDTHHDCELVAVNSGCTAQWRELFPAGQVMGIAAWLDNAIETRRPAFRTHATRVALHIPCSQRGLEGEALAMQRLLLRLPGIELVEAQGAPTCCGAAGTYFVNQPRIAGKLAEELAGQLARLAPDVIISANGGCRAQLAQALHDGHHHVRLQHPAEFLAERLQDHQ